MQEEQENTNEDILTGEVDDGTADANATPEKNNGGNTKVVSSVEEVEPLTYSALYGRSLNCFTGGEWGDSGETIHNVFARYFGQDFKWNEITNDVNDERLQSIAKEVLDRRLTQIKLSGTSLVDDNINQAQKDLMKLVGLNINLENCPMSLGKALFKQRSGDIKELMDTHEVLGYGRRLFDLYNAGTVSPEINADVLKIQNFYRDGAINREILAWYYYNVAMVYEKYSMQRVASSTRDEHNRSVAFLKKALDKTDTNIGLIMNVRDVLLNEPHYNAQNILDACHRVMDNTDDNSSLYLAHKLYAETLAEIKEVRGFNQKSSKDKITEHYRMALGYATALEDKLDILDAIAEQQKVQDAEAYIATQAEIAELLKGRNRIRALNKLERLVKNPEAKKVILKSAINEFIDLSEKRREDIVMYNGLDHKLRALAADEPETIAKLDKIKKKYHEKEKKHDNGVQFTQMSSKGHDIFMN
ncbi:MAG: hypothetical protein J6Y91_04270 [Alphaproteobacteria bacterium]|nr:hypothetical protein [Alphaproteobacteria bacterium]